MKSDNPFIGMSPEEFRKWLDEQNKPGKDDSPIIFDFLFNRNAKVGEGFSANGDKKLCAYGCGSEAPEDSDFCSDACENQFYEEREIEVDEQDCPDDEGIILREEKKSKSF